MGGTPNAPARCYLCDGAAVIQPLYEGGLLKYADLVDCIRCGSYSVSHEARRRLPLLPGARQVLARRSQASPSTAGQLFAIRAETVESADAEARFLSPGRKA